MDTQSRAALFTLFPCHDQHSHACGVAFLVHIAMCAVDAVGGALAKEAFFGGRRPVTRCLAFALLQTGKCRALSLAVGGNGKGALTRFVGDLSAGCTD